MVQSPHFLKPTLPTENSEKLNFQQIRELHKKAQMSGESRLSRVSNLEQRLFSVENKDLEDVTKEIKDIIR